MKNSTVLMASILGGFGCVALIKLKLYGIKLSKKKVDEFWEQETVNEKVEEVNHKADELMDDLQNEADEHIKSVENELNDLMSDWMKMQDEHMERLHKICNGTYSRFD